jgi:hypothetical protein
VFVSSTINISTITPLIHLSINYSYLYVTIASQYIELLVGVLHLFVIEICYNRPPTLVSTSSMFHASWWWHQRPKIPTLFFVFVPCTCTSISMLVMLQCSSLLCILGPLFLSNKSTSNSGNIMLSRILRRVPTNCVDVHKL